MDAIRTLRALFDSMNFPAVPPDISLGHSKGKRILDRAIGHLRARPRLDLRGREISIADEPQGPSSIPEDADLLLWDGSF